MQKKHLLFVMVIAAVLISSLVPTQEASAINVIKIITAPVVYPVKGVVAVLKWGACASDIYRPIPTDRPLCRFYLTDGRHRTIVAYGNEIGTQKRKFRFGVKARTIEVGPYEQLVPYKYTYWWKGKEYTRSINRISTIIFPKSTMSGTLGNLAVNVFYKRVRTIRNPHIPTQTRQESEVMKTPMESRTWTLYYW